MHKLYFTLSILVLASLLAGCAGNAVAQSNKVVPPTNVSEKVEPTAIPEVMSKNPPSDCPVTTAGIRSFEAPAPYPPSAPWPNTFWFGSEHLWTALPADGVWSGLPNNPKGYTQKIAWWSNLFSPKDEPQPDLMMTSQRLDAKAPPVKVLKATAIFEKDGGDAMLGGADFPALGCWEITGQYKKTELSFVVWLAP